MISVTIDGNLKFKNIAEYLRKNFLPIVNRYVCQAINFSAFDIQAHIKQNKLSGQVLQVKTGTLRRSINVKPATPSKLVAMVGVGTDAPYGATHELGLTTKPAVTDKSRSFFWAMWYATQEEKFKSMALTKKKFFTISHKRRPFLLPAYHEKADTIINRLRIAVEEALQQVKQGAIK